MAKFLKYSKIRAHKNTRQIQVVNTSRDIKIRMYLTHHNKPNLKKTVKSKFKICLDFKTWNQLMDIEIKHIYLNTLVFLSMHSLSVFFSFTGVLSGFNISPIFLSSSTLVCLNLWFSSTSTYLHQAKDINPSNLRLFSYFLFICDARDS